LIAFSPEPAVIVSTCFGICWATPKEPSDKPMSETFTSAISLVLDTTAARVWDALVNPDVAKEYFFGARVVSSWEIGSSITFSGEYRGNTYEEKGEILRFEPERVLQYTHWSNLDGVPDLPEHYRVWTFSLSEQGGKVELSVTEDGIPSREKLERSDQYWTGVLTTIQKLLEPTGSQ
jgi:uncharacterized protein YndB with AHSA1/START domain